MLRLLGEASTLTGLAGVVADVDVLVVADETLLRDGTPEQVAEATRRCVAAGGGRRHIVNLSHGCDRAMPVANFEAFVRAAKG